MLQNEEETSPSLKQCFDAKWGRATNTVHLAKISPYSAFVEMLLALEGLTNLSLQVTRGRPGEKSEGGVILVLHRC